MEGREEGEEASEWQLCWLPAEAELVHAFPFETNPYATSWGMVWEAVALLTLCLSLAESSLPTWSMVGSAGGEKALRVSFPQSSYEQNVYGSSTYCLTS